MSVPVVAGTLPFLRSCFLVVHCCAGMLPLAILCTGFAKCVLRSGISCSLRQTRVAILSKVYSVSYSQIRQEGTCASCACSCSSTASCRSCVCLSYSASILWHQCMGVLMCCDVRETTSMHSRARIHRIQETNALQCLVRYTILRMHAGVMPLHVSIISHGHPTCHALVVSDAHVNTSTCTRINSRRQHAATFANL